MSDDGGIEHPIPAVSRVIELHHYGIEDAIAEPR